MTTVNDIQDLIRILDERPEWREDLRRALLTEDFLSLPRALAQLTENLNAFIAETRQRSADADKRFNAFVAEMRELQAQNTADIAELRASVAELRQAQAQNTADIAELRASFAEIRELQAQNAAGIAEIRELQAQNTADIRELRIAVDRNVSSIDRLEQLRARNEVDMGIIKGLYYEHSVRGEAELIADELNFQFVETMSYTAVIRIARNAERYGHAKGILPNHLRSLRRADLVFKAIDAQNRPCLVAAEASYTADERDVERVVRNADFLTRFTGEPAYAVVASVRTDDRIQDFLTTLDSKPIAEPNSGKAYHYEMDDLPR